MRVFLFNNRSFLIAYLIFLLLVLPVIIIFPKGTIHLYINQFHIPFTDFFFKYLTYLGSGVVAVFFTIFFLFISFRKSFIIASSGIITGLVVQILKHYLFADLVRPAKFFEANSNLHLIEGLNMHSLLSFPSGHSGTIFALCLCLAAFNRKVIWKIVLFCMAITIAFSRVYLSQHFLVDIYVGSMIGVLIAIFTCISFDKIRTNWIDTSLLDFQKKGSKDV
jgi:membrane-associated phospholipid phosphatase